MGRRDASGWATRGVAVVICFLGLARDVVAPAAADAPAVRAASAVLVDVASGIVLYEKASRVARPPASTTKVMTALLALEACRPDELIEAGPGVTAVGGAALGLKPGEVMALDDLVAAILVGSANDCAFVIAEHIAGSVEAFAERMNARAAELGAADTHFVNPHGLYHRDHRSSAHDLALITREALRYERFRDLVGSRAVAVALPGAAGGTRNLRNRNKLLARAEFADGVKTGYVNQSGHCLVASGTKEGWQLVAVLLDSPDMYGESLQLLEYGFASYRRIVYAAGGDAIGRAPVRGGERDSVPVTCARALRSIAGPGISADCRLEVSVDAVDAPVTAGTVAGAARLAVDGRVIDETRLLAGEDVGRARGIIVYGAWLLRALIAVTIIALVFRTYAKAVKAHRRRRSHLAPQGGGAHPRRPRAG